MQPGMRRSRRILRRAALITLIVSPLALLTLCLALEHRPDWYRPAFLDEQGVQSARRDATNAVDQFGDQLVRRRPFDVVLRDDALTTWLSAMPHIWPDAAQALPRQLHDPALRFEPGAIRFGAIYDFSGWRALVSAAVAATLVDGGEVIDLRLTEARCGSVRVPELLLGRIVDPHLRPAASSAAEQAPASATAPELLSSLREVRSIYQLCRGVGIRNRFVWPNGKRPFRIDRIQIDAGELRLRIEPL